MGQYSNCPGTAVTTRPSERHDVKSMAGDEPWMYGIAPCTEASLVPALDLLQVRQQNIVVSQLEVTIAFSETSIQ